MKKVTHSLFVFGAAILMMLSIFAFNSPEPTYEYMTFTTIGSIVTGGLNRSWELALTNTGVQSPSEGDSNGIYCMRYTLRHMK